MSDRINDKMYPYNLASTVLKSDFNPNMVLPFELFSVCDGALTEREKKVVELRFCNEATYKQIGEEIGVGAERVRQILARIYRKLNNRRSLWISASPQEVKSLKEKLDLYQKAYKDLDGDDYYVDKHRRIVSDLDLSVRSHNCLLRGGLSTIDDFDGYRISELIHIRNLGKRSAMEIVDHMVRYGFEIRHNETGELLNYEASLKPPIPLPDDFLNYHFTWPKKED